MRINEHGYPTKHTILAALSAYEIDCSQITFSAMYDEGKRVAIFWKRSDIRKAMVGVEDHFESRGIKVRKIKRGGAVESIWFERLRDPKDELIEFY